MGAQCRELKLTVSVADVREDDGPTRDALATWLSGHTERITFGMPRVQGKRLVVDATVHVPCKYLRTESGVSARARCAAHGYGDRLPRTTQPSAPASTQHPDGSITIFHRGRPRRLHLGAIRRAPRSLPVLAQANPCAGAPCRTADHTRGAACCRDLTLEVIAPEPSRRTELLLRSRRSPYLCKVTRARGDIIECEVISACGYLDNDGISCVLHDRQRPDGEPAKPFVCSDWPDIGPDEIGHPGCRLL